YPTYAIALGRLAGVPAIIVAVGTTRLPLRWGALLLAVTGPFVGSAFFNPPLVGMILGVGASTPLLVAFVDGRHAATRCLKAISLSLPACLGLSAYWIVPAMIHLTGNVTPDLSAVSSWSC